MSSESLPEQKVILASNSSIRKKILEDSGISFEVVPSEVEEEELKQSLSSNNFKEYCLALAKAKALDVSNKKKNAYVIGSDQICCYEDEIFSKPLNSIKAIANLSKLSGKTHQLIGSYSFTRNGDVLYEETITTNMTMKPLTETEINDYVELDQPFKSCGSYMFEKNGYKLFSEVEGSLEAINGMPINYLLENLEKHV